MASIEIEKKIIIRMVHIYCKGYEKNSELCDSCKELISYAHARLGRCRWGDNKPSCKRCTKHCYSAMYREKVREVMRYSGRRMLLNAPQYALYHLWKELRYKR